MGKMVLYGLERRVLRIDTDAAQHVEYSAPVAPETPVAVENSGQCPIRRVPVAGSVVPARGRRQGDRREGVGDQIHLTRPDTCLLETEPRCLFRLLAFGVLVAEKPLLFRGRDQFAVHQQSGGGIVIHGAGQTQNDHGATPRAGCSKMAANRCLTGFDQLARNRCRSRSIARARARLERNQRSPSRSSSAMRP